MRSRAVGRNIGWNVVLGPVVLVGNLAIVAIGVRVAGAEDYGVWAICFSAATLGSQLDFGFGTAFVRFSARFHEEGEDDSVVLVRRTGLVIFTGFGLLGAAAVSVLVALYFQINPPPFGWGLLVGVSAVCVFLGFSIRYFVAILQSDQRFLPERAISLLALGAKLALLLPAINATGNLYRVVFADFLGLLILFTGLMACVVRGGYRGSFRPAYRSPIRRKMLTFGASAFVSTGSGLIAMQVPMYVVGAASGYQDVAAVSALTRVAASSRITFSWVTGPLLPHLAQSQSDTRGPTRVRVFDRSVVVLGSLTVSYAALLIGCGGPLLRIWLGPSMGGYGLLAAAVGVYVYCSAMYSLLAVYAIARGRPRLVARQSVLGLAGTICLALWLIPSLGVNGAGLALAVPSSVLWFACAITVASNFRIAIRRAQWFSVLLLLLGSAAALGGATIARADSLGDVCAVVLCGAAVCITTIFLAGLFSCLTMRTRSAGRHRRIDKKRCTSKESAV